VRDVHALGTSFAAAFAFARRLRAAVPVLTKALAA